MLEASFCCVPKSPWQVSIRELSNHTSSTNSRVPRARVLGQSQSPPANLPQGQGRSLRHRVLGCMAVQSWDCLQSSSFFCYPRRCYLCTIWDSQPGLILQHIRATSGLVLWRVRACLRSLASIGAVCGWLLYAYANMTFFQVTQNVFTQNELTNVPNTTTL